MMGEGRFNSMYNGLSAVAKKVYDATPIQAPWSTEQIASEVVRLGRNVDFSILVGCLNTLMRAGLVSEPIPRHFIRQKIRERKPAEPRVEPEELIEIETPQTQTTITMTAKPTPQPKAPIDRIAALAQRARKIAEEARELATDMETAALEIEEQAQVERGEIQKLHQLKSLLKSIGEPGDRTPVF